MKAYNFTMLMILFLCLVTSAFTSDDSRKLKFNVTVEGAAEKNILNEGLLTSEFDKMVIEVEKKNYQVYEFIVTLARGPRPVGGAEKILGYDNINLDQFEPMAKTGDRFSVHITKVKNKRNKVIDVKEGYLNIPIY